MKQDIQNGIKPNNVNVDQMQVFVIINNDGIIINADVNGKNCFIMEDMIKDLFRILVIVNVSVINHVILENIQIIKSIIQKKTN